jgi:hypothetical protein
VGSGYTISGNTIGFANASGTGTTNLVGNSVALTGTFPGSWSTTGTANGTKLIAINCSFTAAGSVSNIQGNTVAGIALFTSSTTSTANGILCGIQLLSGNANIGTTSPNTFGASSGQNSLYTASTGTGGTIVGIYTTSANTVNIQNNIFGAIDAVGTTTSASGGFTGIDVAGSGNYSITGNLIGNTTAGNIRTGYSATSGNLSNTGTMASSSGASSIVGIRSAATGNTLNISSNTLKGFITSGTATTVTGIISSGAMTGTTPSASINSNLLGTAEVGWINYLSANSGPLAGISLSNTIATTHSVQNNDLRGIIHAVAGSQTHTYITLTGATAASNVASISGNTFTNLNVNTTGSVVFIFHGYSIAATGRLTISNNSIVTGFNRASAGSVTITNSDGSSVAGSVNNYLDNNFSNITVTGTSAITGFNNIDGGAGSAKTVTGNTFTNWTGGSGAINVMSFTCWCGTSGLSNNTISDITGQSTVTGINIGASSNNATSVAISSNTLNNLASSGAGGNVTGITCNNTSPNISISENTISNLSATGTSATLTGIAVTGANSTSVFQNTIYAFSGTSATAPIANGISVSAGTTVNVYKNKIYDLQESGAITAGVVNGLLFSGGTTVTAYNGSKSGRCNPGHLHYLRSQFGHLSCLPQYGQASGHLFRDKLWYQRHLPHCQFYSYHLCPESTQQHCGQFLHSKWYREDCSLSSFRYDVNQLCLHIQQQFVLCGNPLIQQPDFQRWNKLRPDTGNI